MSNSQLLKACTAVCSLLTTRIHLMLPQIFYQLRLPANTRTNKAVFTIQFVSTGTTYRIPSTAHYSCWTQREILVHIISSYFTLSNGRVVVFCLCVFFKLMRQISIFFVSTLPYKRITNSGLSNDRSSFQESSLHLPLWLLHTKTEGRIQGLLQDWYGMVTQPDTLLWTCSFESTHAITERKEKRREESKDGKYKRNKHDISRNQQSAIEGKKSKAEKYKNEVRKDTKNAMKYSNFQT
jgi:hypothetical protein